MTRILLFNPSTNPRETLSSEWMYAAIPMFRRFAIAGAVILIALIIYNLRIGENISSEEIFYASDVTIEEIQELPLF